MQKYTIVTVERCSPKMKSCIVKTEEGPVKVDLTSVDFDVLRGSPGDSPSASGASDASGASIDSKSSDDSESLSSHALLAHLMATIDSADVDELLRPSEAVTQATKQAVKEVIDSMKGTSQTLHVDGFDAEQIWVQLDSLSRTAMRQVKRVLQRSAELESVIPQDVEEALDELLEAGEGEDDDGEYDGEYDGEHDGEHDGEERGEDEREDDESEEDDELPNIRDQYRADARGRASWEDEYLNLDEMEAFLQDAEDEAARIEDSDPDDEALDNMLEDMIQGAGRSSRRGKAADQEEAALESDPLANAKHDDFFGPVSGATASKSGEAGKKRKKRVHFIEAEDTDGESEDDVAAAAARAGSRDDFNDEEFDEDLESHGTESDDEDPPDADRSDSGDDAGDVSPEDDDNGPASRHQLRLDRMSDRIQKLEEDALGGREWYMRGEVSGSHRPMNSALEVDLDFETTMKPPPQPTEETTQTLEDLIRQRIADHHFDDVVPILPAKEEKKKTVVELDDVKSTQGLGQIYENEYLASKGQGGSEDKEQPIRDLAKRQFIDLCAKLDQLSHGQFRPLPAIEEVTFKVDVPAVLMEEATPAFVSDASMRKPEEVFRPGQSLHKSFVEVDEDGEEKTVTKREGMMLAGGVAKSEAELTREDRKRRRAAKKRASKKRKTAADAERIQKSMATGRTVISGRKSEESAQMLRKLASTAKASTDKSFKSREVFARLQQARATEKKGDDSTGAVGVRDNQRQAAAGMKL